MAEDSDAAAARNLQRLRPNGVDDDDDNSDDAELHPVVDEADERVRRALVAAELEKIASPTEWQSFERATTATALFYCRKKQDAPDFARDAILLVLQHRRRWDPRRAPNLRVYMRKVIRSVISHRWKSAPYLHEVQTTKKRGESTSENDGAPNVDEARLASEAPNAEEARIAAEEEAAAEALYAEERAEIAKDPDGLALIDCIFAGRTLPRDQAATLGWSSEKVDLVRRRVARAIERVRARHPELAPIQKRAPRGVHAAAGRGNKDDDEETAQ